MALVIKKPISLKERLLASAKAKEEAPAQTTSIAVIAEAAKIEEVSATQVDTPVALEDPLFDVAAQQAYADILPRIDSLVAMSGEALEKEMSILKKALIENPDACSIMLPKDIGKMVEALRRITGQALSEAAAKPKGGAKKQKQLALTPEDMEKAFDEL